MHNLDTDTTRATLLDGGVLLYEEPEAGPAAWPGPACAASSIFGRLLAAGSGPERKRTVEAIVRGLGFDWLVYASFHVAGETIAARACCISHADPAWVRRYVAESYFEVDPRLAPALHSLVPHRWDIDALEATGDRQRRFLADLRHTGMRWGLMFSLPGARAGMRSVVSLLSSGVPGPAPVDPLVCAEAMTLGICLHEFHGQRLATPDAPCADAAGWDKSMQRAVLQGVMRGWADKQIARTLGLSRHTVDYHLRRLRQRFGVQNRVQLAQEAWLREGLRR